MRRPDFFIVGAPRCGTTAMDNYLAQHPDILMAALKESHFFAPDFRSPESGFTNEQDYLSLFAKANGEKVLGESSVGYLYSKVAAANIKEFKPHAKIVIMLRNPIEMIYSYHSWLMTEGVAGVKSNFEAELATASERKQQRYLPATPDVPIPLLIYRELGEFTPHVRRFFDLFGRENVHVIIFDEFNADAARVYRETCEFLGVDSDFQPQLRVINSNRGARSESLSRYLRSLRNPRPSVFHQFKFLVPQNWRRSFVNKLRNVNIQERARPELNHELKQRLSVQFAPDLERLSELLGFDVTHWSHS